MNCREAQDQVFAERDGALDSTQRAALDSHVAGCATCRRIRADLATAFTLWRVEVEKVVVPDAEREWHAVRRRIRGGAEAGTETTARPRRNLVPWLAVPLGAAAATAVALFVATPTPPVIVHSAPVPHTARADSI